MRPAWFQVFHGIGRASTAEARACRKAWPRPAAGTALCRPAWRRPNGLAIHERESDVERSRRVYESLKMEPGTEILDIGCGTGTLVDFRFKDIDPERYVGIDPSRGMLGVFGDKHPEFRSRLIRTPFEDYWPKPGQKFDLVVALFGVPSQIGEPGLLSGKIQWLLNLGGTAELMYNGKKREDMDFYRNLGKKVHGSDGAPVSNEFWTERQDEDLDWLTVFGCKP